MNDPARVAPVIEIDPIARELAAVEVERAAVAVRKDAAEKAREASAKDPAVLLAEAKIALAAEKLVAEVTEHEARMDVVYRDACGAYGFDGVMRIPTRRGSIVLRAQTEEESDVMTAMRDAHRRGAGPSPAEKTLAEANADRAMNHGLRKTVLGGDAALLHFDATVKRYHELWLDLWHARAALVNGRIDALGKGAAR